MIPILGTYALSLVVLAGIVGVLASLASVRLRSARMMRVAHWSVLVLGGGLTRSEKRFPA